ncbi:MAG: twitch domain-containing radical SAM protein, partial [Bdellovibrionales bacterium]|nr:twitch domain-containing radical SAM protein [Bdellovibrionales bacterium]
MSRVVPENLCYMPWSSLTLLPDGRITTCCASLGKGDELGNSKKGDSLLDVWHGDKLKKVREQFLAGEWPKGCLACKKRHTSGLASQKDHYYSVLKGHNLIESIDLESNNLQPLYLDLAFSNVCNLSCRMCSSVFSSKWISVDRHLLEAGFQHLSEHALADSSTETDFRAIASLLPELPHLHIVVIKGGEPLLSKHFVQFLRVLTDKGYAQNIELKMTTNGTIPPSEEVIGLFKEFKK